MNRRYNVIILRASQLITMMELTQTSAPSGSAQVLMLTISTCAVHHLASTGENARFGAKAPTLHFCT